MSGLSITILERENLLNENLDRHIDEKREEFLTRLREVLQEGGKRYFAFFIYPPGSWEKLWVSMIFTIEYLLF
jgi:hypothetical protein